MRDAIRVARGREAEKGWTQKTVEVARRKVVVVLVGGSGETARSGGE